MPTNDEIDRLFAQLTAEQLERGAERLLAAVQGYELALTETPLFVVTVPGKLLSINKFSWMRRMEANRVEGEWRGKGKNNALALKNNGSLRQEVLDRLPLTRNVRIVCKVWWPGHQRMDVHNGYVKPILDGFVDAGLLTDDYHAVVPKFGYEYMGVDGDNPRGEFWFFVGEDERAEG